MVSPKPSRRKGTARQCRARLGARRAPMKSFDDSNIQWRPFAGMGGYVVRIFDVDPATRTVDFAIKFDPNTQVIIHRHTALTHTFVVEGDHVIYEPDGTLRES